MAGGWAIDRLRRTTAERKYQRARDVHEANNGTLFEVQSFLEAARELNAHLHGSAQEECSRYIARAEKRMQQLEVYRGAVAVLRSCRVLGGHGLPVEAGQFVELIFTDSELYVRTQDERHPLASYADITALEVGGPGKTQSGGGYIGGGFGLQGAAEGMLIASALNMLTTKTRVDTVVCLQTQAAELFLHTSEAPPDQLRIQLSPVFTRLRQRHGQEIQDQATGAHGDPLDRLIKLGDLLDRGLIDEDEFRRLKAEILP